MTVGLLLDTFVVRPFLTPAVLTLLGRLALWPSRPGRTDRVDRGRTASTTPSPVPPRTGGRPWLNR